MNEYCVAVTGLPASGKTTIGNLLAAELDVPCLNKDTSLERLFDERCGGNEGYRQRRSRESDDAFRAAETALNRVVLISHWRPLGSLPPQAPRTSRQAPKPRRRGPLVRGA